MNLFLKVIMSPFIVLKFLFLFLISLVTSSCKAGVKINGTLYDYKIIRVVDGDTIDIEANFLPPELGKHLKLRIYGIDTPEKGHQAKCNAERKKAEIATKFVEEKIANAKVIKVELRKWDKFGGRVLGDLIIDGQRLSDLLISEDLAVSYDGGRKNKNWCG